MYSTHHNCCQVRALKLVDDCVHSLQHTGPETLSEQPIEVDGPAQQLRWRKENKCVQWVSVLLVYGKCMGYYTICSNVWENTFNIMKYSKSPSIWISSMGIFSQRYFYTAWMESFAGQDFHESLNFADFTKKVLRMAVSSRNSRNFPAIW